MLLNLLHQIYSSLRGKGGAFASMSMIKHISIVQLNQTGEGILYLYKLAIKGATCKRLTETSTLSGNLFPFSTFHCSTKQWNQCFYLEGKLCECEKKIKHIVSCIWRTKTCEHLLFPHSARSISSHAMIFLCASHCHPGSSCNPHSSIQALCYSHFPLSSIS